MKKPEVKNLVALSLEVNLGTRKEYLEIIATKFLPLLQKISCHLSQGKYHFLL
jgi:hypothetical protein